jgi:outer membrane protein assembly factor BamE
MITKKHAFLFFIIAGVLSGCLKPYTPSIQQGNIITPAIVEQLKTGMTQDDVQYLIGAPILSPTFETNTWHYVYTYQPKDSHKVEEKRLILTFNGQGKLVQIEK